MLDLKVYSSSVPGSITLKFSKLVVVFFLISLTFHKIYILVYFLFHFIYSFFLNNYLNFIQYSCKSIATSKYRYERKNMCAF